jgi:hypothetical protein
VPITRHAPVPGLLGAGLLGAGLLGAGLLGAGLLGAGLLGAGLEGVELAGEVAGPNWVRKRQTSPVVHVVAVLLPPPSTGSGVWSPSNAAHWTGYPARHPVYAVVMCRPLPLAGSGGLWAVQPLARTNVSRICRPRLMPSTLSRVPWMPK